MNSVSRISKIQLAQDLYLPAIETELYSYFSTDFKKIYLRAPEAPQLYAHTMALYHLKTGGKRLRALLPMAFLMDYEDEGSRPSDALPLGIAIELIHNATLIHDDFQDGDIMRRNQPTVWKQFGVEHSINCGDALFQDALLFLKKSNLEPNVLLPLMEKVIVATKMVIEGQSQEFLFKKEPSPTLTRYFEVVEGKTAYLFLAALSGASCFVPSLRGQKTYEQSLNRIAFLLGRLFQIQDDFLDVYGNKGRQQEAADIAEGKISAPILLLLQQARNHEKASIQEILALPREKTLQKDIDYVISLFHEYHIKDECLELLESTKNEISREIAKGLDKNRDFFQDLMDAFLKPISKIPFNKETK